MFWVRFGPLLVVLIAALWMSGALGWLAMAVSFLARESHRERRRLLILRWKLQMLKALAGEIGRTEAHIAEIERSDDG